MDIDILINEISDDEIRSYNILQLYDAVTIRRRIYFLKILFKYIFFISIIVIFNWKYFNENIIFSLITISIIPTIPALIYILYTNIINPRYHYSEFIMYLTNQNCDCRMIEINNELINEKLKEIHEWVENSNEVCTICLTKNKNMIKLNCSKNGFHGGCINCLTEWYRKSNTCPECRQKIFEENTFV